MSFQITEAFVKQFTSQLFHLSQQKGSRLRDKVRNETQVGKSAFYERLGAAAAVKKTSRHSDTPQIDSKHSRRRVTLEDFVWADLIDDEDRIRLLIDPTSQYSESAMWALGRSMDDVILPEASGSASTGEDGGVPVAFPNSQKVVATDGANTAGVNLNVLALRKAKLRLDQNDVDESIPRHFAYNSSALESLLAETEVTSADFNTVRALVMGQVDTFLGFKFVRLEGLKTTTANTTFQLADGTVGSGGGTLVTGARTCLAWAEDGLLLSIGRDMVGRISERDDKHYATQVYAAMGIGSVRMEEEKAVEVLVNQS